MRTELSAGGLVVRDGVDGPELAVIRTKRGAIALPKGHPDASETPEGAALREVREEAGVTADLLGPLGDVEYWYTRRGRPQFKRVTFFLMRYLSGDVSDHDHEVEGAEWIPLADAPKRLSYEGERRVAALALASLSQGE